LKLSEISFDNVRLCSSRIPVPLPYDRSVVTPGIVHLGVGAFARAHLAVYVESVLGTDPSWGIVGASLRSPDTKQALEPQDFLYNLVICSAAATTTRVIGSLLSVLDARRQRMELVKAMTDPRVRIVSLTVTEKGYCHDPATGKLDRSHPDIINDIANPEAPVSAPGLIVRALELRRSAGVLPFTVLSCDNLPANGATTARIVSEFTALRLPTLSDYIRNEVAFPSCMVDRIVPATTAADRSFVTDSTGLYDAWPVVTEPFTQWVIEDHFPAGRPDFDAAGAEFVADVRPFEMMKLRMLNGSHSTIAYLGYLAGYEFVSEAIADPNFRDFIRDLMTNEVVATLPDGLGNLRRYRDALLERFANPALKHRNWQIAMDGSQKLPQRLLGTIRDRLSRGLPVVRLSLGVAAWMRYVSGVDEHGRPIDVRDPLATRLRQITDFSGGDVAQLVGGLLRVSEVFGEDLHSNVSFVEAVTGHLASLLSSGARETVRRLTAHKI
jgi:fructuronate reductase